MMAQGTACNKATFFGSGLKVRVDLMAVPECLTTVKISSALNLYRRGHRHPITLQSLPVYLNLANFQIFTREHLISAADATRSCTQQGIFGA